MQLNGERSYIIYKFPFMGPDSVAGTTIPHGLEGPGIENRWERDFPQPLPFRLWGPPNILYIGYPVSFPRV